MLMNEQNLIPFTSEQSREEAKRNGQKGGKKSGETRRERKKFKDIMSICLNLDVPDEEVKEFLKKMGIDDEDINLQTAIVYKQISKAIQGNLEAAKFCRDTVGEKPTDKVEQSGEVNNIVTIKTSKEVEEWGK